MANVSEIRKQVQAFLEQKLSYQDFEDWSADYSWNIHNRADAETRDLAYAIRGAIVEFSDSDALPYTGGRGELPFLKDHSRTLSK